MKRYCALWSFAALFLAATAADAQQWNLRPLIGGFPAESGFAVGGAVSRTRVLGPVDAHSKAIVSVKKYQLYEAGAEIPDVTRWLSLDVTSRYRNFPQEDYWGLGPDTAEDARANYLLEDFDATGMLTASAGGLRARLQAGFTKINTGAGRDHEFPSVPEPLQSSPRYTHIGASIEYRSLDQESDPHSGGQYSFAWTRYMAGFHRYSIDARRFLPLGVKHRIGLRAQALFTQSSSRREVPFFMLPTAGGTDTVRGFHQYRFRDRNAFVLNSEYRHQLNAFMDLVAFADAGRVFSRSQNIGLRDLHPSAGFGARIKLGSKVFFGVDIGFSREGGRLWFRSDQMF